MAIESCDNDAKMRCGGCKSAWYCGTKCQREAWSTHKVSCNQQSNNNVKKESDEDKKDNTTDDGTKKKATSNHSANDDNDEKP